MIKVAEGKKGTIGWTFECNQEALFLFSEEEQRKIVKTTYQAVGDFWIARWLPKRFSMYAYQLGYFISGKWRSVKTRLLGSAIPYLGFTPQGGGSGNPPYKRRLIGPPKNPPNGEKMIIAALTGARAAGFAAMKGRDARVDIIIPIGHPVQPQTIATFTTVPATEMQTLAYEAERVLTSLINSGQVVATPKANGATRTIQGANIPIRPIGTTPRRIGR